MTKPQKYRDIVQFLQTKGWVRIRSGKGSHEIWGDPACDSRMSIPAHREVSAGIVAQIVAVFPDAPKSWR